MRYIILCVILFYSVSCGSVNVSAPPDVGVSHDTADTQDIGADLSQDKGGDKVEDVLKTCKDDTECPVPDSSCMKAVCDTKEHKCIEVAKPAGAECKVDEYSAGPCIVGKCDGKGQCVASFAPEGSSCIPEDIIGRSKCDKFACKSGECKALGSWCDDGNACTIDTCDEESGQCKHEIITPEKCDDKNPCTDDICDPQKGCISIPNEKGCDDGDACTVNDHCVGGKCVPGDPLLCGTSGSNPCAVSKCDKAKGCVEESAPDGALCDDGDACTVGDKCDKGKCVGNIVVCDDKNPCTNDFCDPKVGCVFVNNNDLCDDGNACTMGDSCVNGVCVGGQPTTCSDGNPCTEDLCDPTSGCKNVPIDGVPCSDLDACTSEDICKGGICVGVPINCDDKNPCTDDKCDQLKGCIYEIVPDGKACDDGNGCTFNDKCQQGFCIGEGKVCEDNNPCTDNKCENDICFFPPNENPCDDGDPCTVGDKCVDKECKGLEKLICDDKNPCTDDVCEKGVGCVFIPNSAPCDDGNACTGKDQCKEGQCVGGAFILCDDGNPCTTDTCDPIKGCVYTPNNLPCDDGNACTTSDLCQEGKCVGGPAPNCDDGNICTTDTCDPKEGCKHSFNTEKCDDGNACTDGDMCKDGKCVGGKAVVCDDQNVCTTDTCDAKLGCIFANNNLPCDDKDACTVGDYCKEGKCVPGSAKVCNDNNPCTKDGCDPSTGCVFKPVTDGTLCDDGNGCTKNDQCIGGKCIGEGQQCDDGNPCTDNKCDEKQGCYYPPNDANPCDDGNMCTVGDYCSKGQCLYKEKLVCNDNNVCTDDSCDPKKGCVFTNNTAPCDDGNKCTSGDKCSNGKCVSGAQIICDDNNICTTDTCDPKVGCVYTNNTLSCDDGDKCTEKDQCSGGKCVGGAKVNCDDNNVCTDDSCDPKLGCTHIYNTLSCNDGQSCTKDDKCTNGQCVGSKYSCSEPNPTCAGDGTCYCGYIKLIPPVKITCDPKTADHCETTVLGASCKCGSNPACSDGKMCCSGQCVDSCSDNNLCTYNDHCEAGKCVGTSYTCKEPNPTCLGDGTCNCGGPIFGVNCGSITADNCWCGFSCDGKICLYICECRCGKNPACSIGYKCSNGTCVKYIPI